MDSRVARIIADARGLRKSGAHRIWVLFFLGNLDLSIV